MSNFTVGFLVLLSLVALGYLLAVAGVWLKNVCFPYYMKEGVGVTMPFDRNAADDLRVFDLHGQVLVSQRLVYKGGRDSSWEDDGPKLAEMVLKSKGEVSNTVRLVIKNSYGLWAVQIPSKHWTKVGDVVNITKGVVSKEMSQGLTINSYPIMYYVKSQAGVIEP